MNFDLSEEQALLRNLVEKFAGDRYDPAKRLTYVRQTHGFCPQGWAALADTGLLAFPFAEEFGGFGGGSVELITVMEAMGRAVAVEPLLPVILMAGGVIDKAGTDEQKRTWLSRLATGESMASLAHGEHQARFNQASISTRSKDSRLNGAKQMVLGASVADVFVVSAVDEAGMLGFFLVKADAPGLVLRHYRMTDGSSASDLVLTNVSGEWMAGGLEALDEVLLDVRLAICAELVGLMAMMFDATLDYIKTRKQFSQPIGAFQAIQHRMADNYARMELSRSQLYRAAGTRREDAARAAAITGAKAYISASAMALGEDAVQLHGGIGTTEELMVGQAFKRVMLLASLLGDSDWELRRYEALVAA
ncbi:acyl-CoA dehydrogenase family protein [Sphingobium sp. WCS2017Hpa-17]|uniref:acyl-CoA dehydrogenase family protein n=1 Tax=Sphingobium sp. WCS2017Hpa-17 TaxID=3073638 RepID=UPI00288A492C|nr:acyl-CoA dehydrogenase family protein [Sphingobium sp. WCS2017Hpa-17]